MYFAVEKKKYIGKIIFKMYSATPLLTKTKREQLE